MAAASGLTPSTRDRSTAWNGPARLQGVDLARGLAVLGMFAAHLLDIDAFEWSEPQTWIDVANGRSSILFAVLAGVSIALVTGGTRPVRGGPVGVARRRIAVRAVLLWVLGVALMATGVPVYVILPAYGILFLVTLPVLGLGARALWPLAVALALVMPWVQPMLDVLPVWSGASGGMLSLLLGWHYPFPLWTAFVVAGLAIGRLDLRALRTQTMLLGGGALAALTAYGSDAAILDRAGGTVWTAEAHSGGILEVVGSGGFAAGVLGLCLLASRTPLTWVVLPLRAVGSMPLTAYTAQLVVWAIAAAVMLGDVGDLGGFREAEAFWPLTLGTVVVCTVWALLLGRGPLETLFASVSTRLVPDGGHRRTSVSGG